MEINDFSSVIDIQSMVPIDEPATEFRPPPNPDLEVRKKRRADWVAENEARQKWELYRRLADVSTDIEFLTHEVARIKRKLKPPTSPASLLPEQERRALETSHARRLADLVTSHCRKVLQAIMAHKWALPFLHPVDLTVYKDYLEAVAEPMDFGTIAQRMQQGMYLHPDAFLADVRLVFDNARAYNEPGSDVHVMANTLQDKFEDKYASTVLPKLLTIEGAAQADIHSVRKQMSPVLPLAAKDPLATHTELLLKYMNEVALCVSDAKSAAASLCKPVGREEKQQMIDQLKTLSQGQFEKAISIVMRAHSGLQPRHDLAFDLNSLDALTLRQLQSYIQKCVEYNAANMAHANGDDSAGEPLWPNLLYGVGAVHKRKGQVEDTCGEDQHHEDYLPGPEDGAPQD